MRKEFALIRCAPIFRLALLRHNLAVAAAILRALPNRMGDLLTLLVILPFLVLVARAWMTELPLNRRALLASAASFLIASTLSQALLERVRFHQSDGALAHHAQRLAERLSFVLPLLVAGILGGCAALAVIGIMQPVGWALGACAGTASGLAIRAARELLRRRWHVVARPRFSVFGQRHFQLAGIAVGAGIGTICAFLPSDNHLDAMLAGGYGLAVILLTARVDARTVRYMTMVGCSSASILRKWLPIQLALLLPVAAPLAIAHNWILAAVAALFALGLPTFTAIRILAYRAFSRVIADWVTTMLISAAAFFTLILPPLGPAVMIAAIVWLFGRSKSLGWLIG